MNNKNNTIEIKELAKDITLLYVDDEKDCREDTEQVLKLLFKEVITAVDGIDAKDKLINKKPDLLITDTKMPNMDGFELVEYVKQNAPELPIIITSAHDDKDDLVRYLNLKVDSFLLKPISNDRLTDSIYQIVKIIDNRKKARELEEYKIQQMIDYSSDHIVDQILGSLKSPCMIYTGGKLRYSNRAFNKLTDSKDIESMLDKRSGFISKLDDYNEDNPAKNKVSISKQNGRKVYRVIKNNINIDEVVQTSKMYLFVDITLEEFQKVKIKSYTEILESLVFKTRYHQSDKTEEQAELNEQKEIEISDNIGVEDREKLVINDEENELLRRSHKYKTTAKEYAQDLDDEILMELQELDELDKDLADYLYILNDDFTIEGIKKVANKLDNYAHEINMLFEFRDLSYAIQSLATLFNTVDESKLADEKKIKKILILLDGIKEDLAVWRRVIFIDQSALDIHYLDSSLFSACLQIELVLSDEIKEMENEEDDLILF